MNNFDKNTINSMDEGTWVRGYALIQNYSLLPQKNGGQYISGQLQVKGQVPFKVWSNTDADSVYVTMINNSDSIKNSICMVEAMVNKYGGVTSLILNKLIAVDEGKLGLSKSDFFEEVYDADKWYNTLMTVLHKNCSEKAINLFENLINPIFDRFKNEFAAVYHHDNCKSGLLAHTTKVVRIATIVKMYPALFERLSPDVLFLSCALHDVGKIVEYNDGIISERGKMLSHHTFGVLFLVDNKDLICSSMGDDFFYELLSVVEQHHGEYEERPRTVLAYVVHKLDAIDAHLTSLNSLISEGNTGDQIQYDGYKLI